MRRAGLWLLAIAVVLAGCPGDGSVERTLTPAPVPAQPTATQTAVAGIDCDVSTPAQPSMPSLDSVGSASISALNGSVTPSAVAARHDDALRDHRYRLRTRGLYVDATRNRSTALVRSISAASGISHYVADGRIHTYYYHEGGGGDRYTVSEYAGEPVRTIGGANVSLSGRGIVEEALAVAPHHVERVRDDDWTVIRASIEEPTTVDNRTIYRLNSTIVVDTYGIVRSLDQRLLAASPDGTDRRWSNRTLTVSALDRATFERPAWVCLAPERLTDDASG